MNLENRTIFVFLVLAIVIFCIFFVYQMNEPVKPETTHTMQEVISDIRSGKRRYKGETIIIAAEVKDIKPYSANQDLIWFETNNKGFYFSTTGDRGLHEVGSSYVFKLYIEDIWSMGGVHRVSAQSLD